MLILPFQCTINRGYANFFSKIIENSKILIEPIYNRISETSINLVILNRPSLDEQVVVHAIAGTTILSDCSPVYSPLLAIRVAGSQWLVVGGGLLFRSQIYTTGLCNRVEAAHWVKINLQSPIWIFLVLKISGWNFPWNYCIHIRLEISQVKINHMCLDLEVVSV